MSFNEIKGLDKQIGILKGYLKKGCLEGAYLFCGPEGIGKKLVAKMLAKAANCEEKGLEPCGRCASCMKIENNQHPDVHIIEPQDGKIHIDAMRQLQREIKLKPYEAESKVVIINDARLFTGEAAACLLKSLEEPPKGSLVILISDRPALLFKTIISRCKIVKFTPLKREELKELLRKEYGIEKSLAHFLAYFSEGRLGFALRLKDTDIMNHKNRIINELTISRHFESDNLPLQDRPEVRSYLNMLAFWFRDIYLVKAGLTLSETVNSDRSSDLARLTRQFSFQELDEILDSVSDSIFYLERNINVRLLLYNLWAKINREAVKL